MPELDNPRQEAFAQGLVKGLAKIEAYRLAGYTKPSDPVASRLSRDVKIVARMKELQGKTAAKFEITVERMAAQFEEDRVFARELKQASAAHAASVSLAKLAGLMVDKLAVTHDYSSMTEAEIRAEMAAIAAEARLLRPGVRH